MFGNGVSTPRLVRLVAFAASFATPCLAEAAPQPTPTQIREAADAFDRGREAYKNEDYVTAAEQFERADAQAGSPTALEYAVRSRDKASQLDRAATLAALVAKRYPDNAALEKLATDVLQRARASLYELDVQCADPCDLAVDDKIVPGAPDLQRTVYLPEGAHTLRAGFGSEQGGSEDVTATTGGKGRVSFDAPAAPAAAPSPAEAPHEAPPAPPSPPPAPRHGWSPAVFWVGAGLTGVAAAVTVWSGIDTVNNPGKDNLKTLCAQQPDTSCAAYQQGLAHERRTNILIGTSAGLGVVTILIGALATDWGAAQATHEEPDKQQDEYLSRRDRARKQRAHAAPRVTPWLSVGSTTMLGAEGRF